MAHPEEAAVTPEELLDAVEAWHTSGDEETRPLHEYLGMTWDEYGAWVRDPMVISCDCSCHKTIEQGGAAPGDCDHCRVLG